MTIALDATAACTHPDQGGGSSPLWTGTINVGALTNGILMFACYSYQSLNRVQLDSSTGADFVSVFSIPSSIPVQLWYLLNPPPGNHQVYVRSTYPLGGGALSSWDGVDQTTPLGDVQTSNGVSVSPTLTLAGVSGCVIIDSGTDGNGVVVKDSLFTTIVLNSGALPATSTYRFVNGTTTDHWSSTANDITYGAAVLNPASGGSSSRNPRSRLLNHAALVRASRW